MVVAHPAQERRIDVDQIKPVLESMLFEVAYAGKVVTMKQEVVGCKVICESWPSRDSLVSWDDQAT